MNQAVELGPLRWWEIEELLEIEREAFGADGWRAEVFWSELAQHDTRYYLAAREQGRVNGYAGLAAAAGEAFVQTLAVRRSSWGRGIGSALLVALLDEAGRRGAGHVLLEVRADDLRPQALYGRFGFVPVGRRRAYYQPSGADALVLRRG